MSSRENPPSLQSECLRVLRRRNGGSWKFALVGLKQLKGERRAGIESARGNVERSKTLPESRITSKQRKFAERAASRPKPLQLLSFNFAHATKHSGRRGGPPFLAQLPCLSIRGDFLDPRDPHRRVSFSATFGSS